MSRRRSLRRLLARTRPHILRQSGALAAAIVVALVAPVMPMLIRAVIDDAIAGRDGRLLAILLATMLGVGLVKAAGFGLRRLWAGEVAVAVEADLREELYEHVQALDVGYHERTPTGQLMSRGSSDLQAVRQVFMMLPWGITLGLQVVVVVAVIVAMDAPLALMALATLPVMALETGRFAARFDPVVGRVQQSLAEVATVVEETVTGIRVVKAFGREAHQSAKLAAHAGRLYDHSMDSIRLRARFVGMIQLLPSLGVVAVLWYGGRRVLSGHITIGTLVAFNAYLAQLIWPVRALGMITAAAQRAASASRRIFEVLDTRPGIEDGPDGTPLEMRGATVRFEGVRFVYPGAERPVLDGVDLVVPAGSSLALVGATGCGKSTLVKLVPRFMEPVEGRVTIDDVDVSAVTLRSLRTQIGMVFEDTFLFSDTIRANIAFGRPDVDLDAVVAAAVTAQAHAFIVELPDGYDSVVGEQGYTLSGGQRQRIAIARAVLMAPGLLILDDATSSVDPRVEAAIRTGLREAMHGRTTLIVARRASTAALADRVAYMEHGRIVASGTHEELWRTLPAYREVLAPEGSVDELREAAS